MHAQQLGSLAILLATLVAAAPAPAPAPGFSLIPRSLSWTNQPSTEPICTNVNKDSPDTAAYSNDDIAAAIQAAVNAIVNNKLLKGAGKGKTLYPHRNKPDSAKSSQDKWSDYNLPECAQAPDPGFIEFPILRDHSVYTGGEGGPDRVLFQFVTDGNKDVTYPAKGMNGLVGNFQHAAYCGLANHVLNKDNTFLGGFAPCDNSKGTTITCPDGGCSGSVG